MEFISEMTNSWWFASIGMPILICCARIIDVTISTIRIIFVSKGQKYIAPVLGFFEVIVWLLAITQVMQHLDHWQNYIAYALGFALGNFFGIIIEERLALGYVMLTVATKTEANELADKLMEKNVRTAVTEAMGNDGKVNILFTIIKRSQVSQIVNDIKNFNPWAVYSVNDMRYVDSKMLNIPVNTETIKKYKHFE
ncbi:MAG: DUF2179 domain-containing protein [Campylobacter sp.]|nr:DUF2179 domain-containing protein [Campylobacter sp.]